MPPDQNDGNGLLPSGGLTPIDAAIIKYESGGRNILQQQVDPSISSASGYYQITNSTWKDIAPKAGIDTNQYPTAMSAPFEVQTAAEHALRKERGLAPWVPYNPALKNYLAGAGSGTESQANPLAALSQANPLAAPLPSSVFQPVKVPEQPGSLPTSVTVNMPGATAPSGGPASNPLAVWGIIQAMMAGTHKFTPVDYDPWAIEKRSVG